MKGWELIRMIAENKAIKEGTKINVKSGNKQVQIEFKNGVLNWKSGEFNTGLLCSKNADFEIVKETKKKQSSKIEATIERLYVIQASTNKGENWINCVLGSININGLIASETKKEAKSMLETYYELHKKHCERTNVKPLPKKWFRIKEFEEVEE